MAAWTLGQGGSELESSHPTSMTLEFKPPSQWDAHPHSTFYKPNADANWEGITDHMPPSDSRLRIQQPRRQKPYLPHLSCGVLVCTCSHRYLETASVYQAAISLRVRATKAIALPGSTYFCNFHTRLIFLHTQCPLLRHPLTLPLPLLLQ